MLNIVASCSNFPIIGPIIDYIAYAFGYLMSGIYWVFDSIGIANLGLCIIVFTLIIKAALMPLTFRQQKSAKVNAFINPEIQEIQKKYKNKKDQDSMMKQQAEIKEVYAKYGTSQTAGCLQLLIQIPILFALYQVIRSIPAYVPAVSKFYENIVDVLSNNYITNTIGATGTGDALRESAISKLAIFTSDKWDHMFEVAANSPILETLTQNYNSIKHINTFLGMDLGESPWTMMMNGAFLVVLLPLLSAGSQFISTKLTPMNAAAPGQQENQMASTMKSMNFIMPLFSLYFVFTLPAGIGIYWTMSGIFQIISQMLINRHLNKVGIDSIR